MSLNKRNSVNHSNTIDEIKDMTMTPTNMSTLTGTGTYALIGENPSRFNSGLKKRLIQRD